jgi:hypothetical protein
MSTPFCKKLFIFCIFYAYFNPNPHKLKTWLFAIGTHGGVVRGRSHKNFHPLHALTSFAIIIVYNVCKNNSKEVQNHATERTKNKKFFAKRG